MTHLHTALFALVALASTACAAWQPDHDLPNAASVVALLEVLQDDTTCH